MPYCLPCSPDKHASPHSAVPFSEALGPVLYEYACTQVLQSKKHKKDVGSTTNASTEDRQQSRSEDNLSRAKDTLAIFQSVRKKPFVTTIYNLGILLLHPKLYFEMFLLLRQCESIFVDVRLQPQDCKLLLP